jgi:hypothetical protein
LAQEHLERLTRYPCDQHVVAEVVLPSLSGLVAQRDCAQAVTILQATKPNSEGHAKGKVVVCMENSQT